MILLVFLCAMVIISSYQMSNFYTNFNNNIHLRQFQIKNGSAASYKKKAIGTKAVSSNNRTHTDKEMMIDYENLLGCRKLPDILIIGFEKCGTLTLKNFLNVHPDIFIKKLFGNYELFNAEMTATVEEYTVKEPCTPAGQLRLDKSATGGQPSKAFKMVPGAKLIAIVKEPVERTMSQYLNRIADGIEKKPYDFDAVATSILNLDTPIPLRKSVLFRQSKYSERLEPWVKLYGIDKIHIVDGENFIKHPVDELRKVEQFLGLRSFISEEHFIYNSKKKFYCLRQGVSDECMVKTKGRPHQVMLNSTRIMLQEHFKPFNEKLFAMIGRRLPWNY